MATRGIGNVGGWGSIDTWGDTVMMREFHTAMKKVKIRRLIYRRRKQNVNRLRVE